MQYELTTMHLKCQTNIAFYIKLLKFGTCLEIQKLKYQYGLYILVIYITKEKTIFWHQHFFYIPLKMFEGAMFIKSNLIINERTSVMGMNV